MNNNNNMINNTTINNKYITNPSYIAGLIQADGSFHVKIARRNHNIWLIPTFNLTLQKSNIDLIIGLQQYFGVGHYRIDNKGHVRYSVTKLTDLTNIIIPFFLKYKLRGHKYISFLLFKIIVDQMIAKNHHSSEAPLRTSRGDCSMISEISDTHSTRYNIILINLINMAYNMNPLGPNGDMSKRNELLRYLNNSERNIVTSKLTLWGEELLNNELQLYPNTSPINIDYIKGLFDGDGNITVYLSYNRLKTLRIRMYFNIAQDKYNKEVLDEVKAFFNCGYIYNIDNSYFRYDIKSVSNINTNLLQLFGELDSNPLGTVKIHKLWYVNEIIKLIHNNNIASLPTKEDVIKVLNLTYYVFNNTDNLTKDQYINKMLTRYNL
jgi:hypothetical protein